MTEGRSLIWRRIMDEGSFEHARIEPLANGLRLSGTVLIAENGKAQRVDYTVECDPAWETRSVTVMQAMDGEVRTLLLHQPAPGVWHRDGARDHRLDGCTDVDLGVSPMTNSLPIGRLGLKDGETREIRAAWVLFPSLEVRPALQAYERLAERSYLYRGVDSGFTARLDLDADGITREYEGIWTRVADGPLTPTPEKPGFASALMAAGPADELGPQAHVFDWLIGGWQARVIDYAPDGTRLEGTGEWWFSWVLEGRAIQDVWISPPRAGRDEEQAAANRYGSTLRWYDREKGGWRVRWINLVSGAETRLTGRREGNRVLMEGEEGGRPIRWYFEDVTATPVVWRGETQLADGTWHLEAEFQLRRVP